MSKTVKFKQWDCVINYAKYDNDATAIQLTDATEGDPIGTPTVNIYEKMYSKEQWEELRKAGITPSNELPKNKCYIKTYSENQGMLEVLVESGIVDKPEIGFDVNGYGALVMLVNITDPNFKD